MQSHDHCLYSKRGKFVVLFSTTIFPLHSSMAAPCTSSMASGACSCEVCIMLEPSCEGFQQPEWRKGAALSSPFHSSLASALESNDKWHMLLWGVHHAGALLWGVPAARMTKGATSRSSAVTKPPAYVHLTSTTTRPCHLLFSNYFCLVTYHYHGTMTGAQVVIISCSWCSVCTEVSIQKKA